METEVKIQDHAYKIEEEVIDFEMAVEKTGHGRFHLLVLLAGSLCLMSSGFENALNAYIIPSAQCDLHISTEGMGLLNILFMSGSISSAYFCGVLADIYGRKMVLIVSMALDAFVLLISSFSPNLNVLLACRFVSGFLSGVPASLIIPYVGEFHTAEHRKTSVCLVGFFWALSWMLAPGIAWLVVPMDINYYLPSLKFDGWRAFVCLFAIPNAFGAIFLQFLPETPRFLLAVGQTEEAHGVLKRMFAYNKRKSPEEYPITLAQLFSATETLNGKEGNSIENSIKERSFTKVLCSKFRQTAQLMKPPYLHITCICLALMASNMFGGYGLGLWLPEMIQRIQDYHSMFPNESESVCNRVVRKALNRSPLKMLNATTSTDFSLSTFSACDDEDRVNNKVFRFTLIIGAACLVGDVFYGFVVNKVSHKVILAVPMLVAALSSTLLYFADTSIMLLVISCIFQTGVELAYFGIYSVVMENFPTSIRAIAMCLTVMAGRSSAIVINVLFGELFDAYCEVPIFVTAGVLAVGVVLSLMVPSRQPCESSDTKTEEVTTEDGEDYCDTKL